MNRILPKFLNHGARNCRDPAAAAALALETSGGDPAAIAELEDEEKKQPKLKGTVQQPGGQSVDVGVVEVCACFGILTYILYPAP
jgi:hypothetical protein